MDMVFKSYVSAVLPAGACWFQVACESCV